MVNPHFSEEAYKDMNRVLYPAPVNPLVVEYFIGQKYFGSTELQGVPFSAFPANSKALRLEESELKKSYEYISSVPIQDTWSWM